LRLLLRLRALEDSKYEMQYHYHLQGFIYGLLKDSKYSYLHDKGGYKFFCFSNIFPAYHIKRGDVRTLIISSPDEALIDHLFGKINGQIMQREVNVGCMQFNVGSVDKINICIPSSKPFSLITGTPIIVRIPREKYIQYDIKPKWDYEYVYWRAEYPILSFAIQLESNLIKKYISYSGYDLEPRVGKEKQYDKESFHPSLTLFQKCTLKKQVSTKILMNGFDQTVIGSVWKFDFEGWEDKKLVQFALDTGLGERNSLGFGFTNLIGLHDGL